MTDIHAHATGHDYYTDTPAPGIGLTRLAPLIAAARAEAANCLLLDNGDTLQGNPMGDLFAAAEAPAEMPHPLPLALAALGTDVATPGNHDFNYGVDWLLAMAGQAAYPVVCANVAHAPPGAAAGADRTLFPAFTLLARTLTDTAGRAHTVRIGVTGVCPPQILNWDRRLLAGRLAVRDMVEAVAATVPRMRAAGADVVVVLAHCGPGAPAPAAGAENAARHIAALPGVDALVTGHIHKRLPGPDVEAAPDIDPEAGRLAGRPAVMPGMWASHLGVIDLDLARGDGRWRAVAGSAALRTVPADAPEDPALSRLLAPAHAATLAHVRRPVGEVTAPLTTYFALLGDDAAVQLIARAQAEEARRALDGGALADLPVISMASPFKAGGQAGPGFYTDIPAGPVSIAQVSDLYLFPNSAAALMLTGAQVADWLERSAAIFAHVPPGAAEAELLVPGAAAYNFDIALGLTYRIDPSRQARFDAAGGAAQPKAEGPGRIRDLCWRGRPVDPAQRFLVVTNSYRAGGGGDFPHTGGGAPVWESADSNRDALIRWIARNSPVTPETAPCWSFAALDGARAVYRTGPGAQAHLHRCPAPGAEPAGRDADGFLRLRVTL